MKKTLTAILLSASILLLGCGSTNASSLAHKSVAAVPTMGAPFAFSPVKLVVHQKTMVTWSNRTVAPHAIKSVGGWHFLSKLFGNGQKVSFIFKKIGTFKYVCSIHPFMHGTIIVKK